MILNELYETRTRLKQAELTALEDQIRKANRIFVAGAGRSLLMIRGFAMRLMPVLRFMSLGIRSPLRLKPGICC